MNTLLCCGNLDGVEAYFRNYVVASMSVPRETLQIEQDNRYW